MIIASSCATLNLAEFTPVVKGNILLPALEPRFDVYSAESAYSIGYSRGTSAGFGTPITKNVIGGLAISNSTIYRDPRVQDAKTFFDHDVKDNITNPFGEKKGYIVCKIVQGNTKKGYGWAVLSGLALMAPNFLGMPVGEAKTSLEVEVEIYDLSDTLIGRYHALGSDIQWVAMYYGYTPLSASRKSGIKAFQYAMNDIKSQIVRDADRLNFDFNR